MERVEGWLIDADYETIDGRAVVRLWCKDEQGIFVAYDYNFDPYFYVIGVDEDILKNTVISTKKEVVKVKSYEKALLKSLNREVEGYVVYAHHPQQVPKLRDYLSQFGDVREADIPFAYRYLIDRDLACMDGIYVEGERLVGKLRSYRVNKVERIPKMEFPELNMLVFDCEMLSSFGMPEPEKDPIIVISMKMDDDGETILSGDERKIIADFVKIVKEYDPDIIVGYNQNAFDWPYLRKRAENWNIPLSIGRDGSNIIFRGGRPKITGRLNVDLYDIAVRISDVKIKKLENVAEYLGTKIEIADIEAKDIYKHWSDGDKEKVLAYARQDAINTYLIAKELLPMHYELSKMIRLPVDDLTRMGRGKQVDWLLLSEARKFGEVAPNPPEHGMSYEGAFVLEPERGLHENVVCLDFASMYPSIMIAFNISPDTFGCREDCNEAPEVGHKFRKSPDGFFKRILKMLIERRREIKAQMKNLDPESPEYRLLDIKQQTLKVLTNSFYGYMGWNLARWYCHPCAEATTAWGRHFIKTSAKIAESMGFKVLYGDTDSIFVTKAGMTKEDVERLIDKLHEELPIQIEVDEYYSAIFFVEKKRYAGLTEDGRLVVKGLEVRRGDWCELAKKIQREVIEVILKEKNPEKALTLVKDLISRIKSGDVTLEDVVIYKGLTKKPSKYESMQAHVKAALKAKEMGIIYPVSSKIGYVIVKGSGNVGDRAYPIDLIEDFDGENLKIKTKSGIVVKRLDRDYYIDNQILPSVLRILERFGYSETSVKGKSQMSLDSFF